MKVVRRILGSILVSCVMLTGCMNSNGNADSIESLAAEKDVKSFADLIQCGEASLHDGEYGSAKKYFLEAYENKEGEDDYKVYADLYLVYTLLNKKESANSIHREVLDDLNETKQQAYLEYMNQVINNYDLDVKPPTRSDMKEEKVVDKTKESKDTEPPVFTKFSSEVYADVNEHFNFNDFYKAKDDSDFALIFDDSNVDYGKRGKYNVTIIAEDIYGNKASQNATVIIVDYGFKYSAGLYRTQYDINIRTEPNTSSSIVATIPSQAAIIVGEVYRMDDNNYWAKLSTGYACIENADGLYMCYESAIPTNANQFDDFKDFEKACDFKNVPFGFTVVPKGINYTAICEGPAVY